MPEEILTPTDLGIMEAARAPRLDPLCGYVHRMLLARPAGAFLRVCEVARSDVGLDPMDIALAVARLCADGQAVHSYRLVREDGTLSRHFDAPDKIPADEPGIDLVVGLVRTQ